MLAAVGRWVGAEDERQEPPGFFQPCPDASGVTRRVQAGGITNGHPANRDPGLWRHHAADMDGAAERDTAGSAHLRIVEDHAQVALPEATVGLLPCAGGTQNLPRLVGEGWAKRMILLGERINAETALRIGLAEEKVGKGEAKALALEWAKKAGKQSPTSIAACKTLVQSTRSGTHASALVAEREAFVDLFDTADQVEGVTAFLKKRAAQWKNA